MSSNIEVKRLRFWSNAVFACFISLLLTQAALAGDAKTAEPVKVKVLIGAMFEIGQMQGDKAGEFQYWYQRYFANSEPMSVVGASNPIYCNAEAVCGAVLGMGKVASSSNMLAILLDQRFDFSQSYFLITGVAGIPPSVGTIGDVSWASWLVDYDLGHRWSPEEEPAVSPAFKPRAGYESLRSFALNQALINKVYGKTQSVALQTSPSAERYKHRYSQPQARRKPRLLMGTHVTGDTFFHGPGLSREAQYITELYDAPPYTMTEMEAAAIAQVINRLHGIQRLLSLRGAVNFDQGSASESTLQHLDPAPGNTAGGFDITLQNIVAVGGHLVDDIVAHWSQWRKAEQ